MQVADRAGAAEVVESDAPALRAENLTAWYGGTTPAIKGINSARIYVSTNNLFTITKYTGYDPEVNTYAGSNTTIGGAAVTPPACVFASGARLPIRKIATGRPLRSAVTSGSSPAGASIQGCSPPACRDTGNACSGSST